MIFNPVTYFTDVATRLKEIQHNDAQPRFHKIMGIGQLFQFLVNMYPGYHLLYNINSDGRFLDDDPHNKLTLDRHIFYIAKDYQMQDYEDYETQKEAAKSVLQKVIAKMIHDMKEDRKLPKNAWTTGLAALDLASIRYDVIGKVGDSFLAVYCSFSMLNNFPEKYDPNDYLDA